MDVSFQENSNNGAPYTAVLNVENETIHENGIFKVPVYKDSIGQGYFADLCGFRVKAKELNGLESKMLEVTEGLINMARMPRHVFVARRAKRVFPIYTVGNEVLATTSRGPVFRHVELAKLREYMTDYLHQAEILGEKGLSDKLHVRGTSLKTLQLRRPVFYLKKRIVGEPEFWAPVFETENLDGLYTYAASDRREIKNEYGGKGVLVLTRIVAEALKTEKRLNNIYDLRPDRLQPGFWEKLKPNLVEAGSAKINGKDVDLFTSDGLHIGLEYREQEERYGLFLADSASELESRISSDFTRRGIS